MGFFYDVRSIHSWGLPRRRIPEDRLKSNAAGFSSFGSLEIYAHRGTQRKKADREMIKSLKEKLSASKKYIRDLKEEKVFASKEASDLKKKLEEKKELLRNLRPCRLFDGKKKTTRWRKT